MIVQNRIKDLWWNIFFKNTVNCCLTEIALNTKGSPAILLLDILKCVMFSPMAVIRSDRHELEAALRELAVVG